MSLPIRRVCQSQSRHPAFIAKRLQSGVAPLVADFSSLKGSVGVKPNWKPAQPISVTTPPEPEWKYGGGANDNGISLRAKHVEIDPFAKDRPMFHNYSLLISGIVPRPIGFISTLSKEGEPNLAPFSYFQVVDHDPPVFTIGFSGRGSASKDTLRNLQETGECTINTVSEHMIEAVNAASIDAPRGVSEWDLAGLHQAPSTMVKPSHVQESVFSVEGKLSEVVDFKTSTDPVGAHGKLAIIEGVNFWVRADAIDTKGSHIDLEVLRPIGQLGGISYARMSETFELPRSNWKKDYEDDDTGLRKMFGD
ncbi:hypothetical protein CKM354_000790800 [Cercospora kikuchii]|uniref:Flavin reductase like domain-containing protein n=1 Tax=Cercospora kikuchii TaxID=84275 RepID=A0A9P3FHW0_9PEZI|nr:uncharacterized protein CKM354_000790800 [Cercospora kikuchii]GIZ44717.1 hypothetical protein CKM354_000790800 [Cercospora kikuchii]